MVDAHHHAAVGPPLAGDGTQLIIRQAAVQRQGQQHILTMAADVLHLPEGLTADAIGEIIIIGVIPGKGDVLVLPRLGDSGGPLLVMGVVGIHDIDRAVGPAQLMQDIVLIDILGALTAVAQVEVAVGGAHVKVLHVDCLLHHNSL